MDIDDLGYDPDNPPGSQIWEHEAYLPGSYGYERARLIREWEALRARLPWFIRLYLWLCSLSGEIRRWVNL